MQASYLWEWLYVSDELIDGKKSDSKSIFARDLKICTPFFTASLENLSKNGGTTEYLYIPFVNVQT